jgi:4-amino-4-deoxy-L-arabinose transferase-like glycosyltransferase
MKPANTTQKLIILGLTLLAFLLRAYRLDFQSYWIDEGWTVFFAHLSLDKMWYLLQTTEIVPPFYHPSTIYWIRLVGDSEYALRFYSLIFGVVAVPFTYRLGKDLGDNRLGLILALLMAVSPYQIWHSQDARMYTILTAASAMSMWGFVNIWQQGGWRWWLVYVVGTEWAMLTHYHGVVLIGIQGLFLLLTWRHHWRGYLKWGASLLLMFLIYLPWLAFGGNLLQSYTNWVEQTALGDTYLRSAIAYSVGELVPHPQAIPLMLVFVLVYGVGLLYASSRRWGTWSGPEMLALLLAYTIAPNIAAWVYGELRTVVYLERYLILVQVGYLLAVAMGVLALVDRLPLVVSRIKRRLAAALLLLTLISINGWVLYHHYFDPLYAKPDWRAVVQTIENFSMPGDAILLTGDGGEYTFLHYYQGNLPVYYSFNVAPHRHDVRKEGEEARQVLANITANHQRLWYTPYGMYLDPMLEQWLASNTHPAWHSWLGRKRLALYDTQATTPRQETLNTTFADSSGQGPTLTNVALPGHPVAAGDLLPLTLTWQTATPLAHDYQLSLRLLNLHGDIFAQSDWPPLAAAGPTSTWPPHQPLTDQRSLWLPPDTPPGKYTLQFVVYDPASGQSLGQPVPIPGIVVSPAQITPPLEALPIPNPTRQPLGDLTLAGYAAPERIQPGQEMWLWLYWQAQKPPGPNAIIHLSLSSEDETITTDFLLTDSIGSVDSWQAGQVRRAVYHLPTSPRLAGQKAAFNVGITSAAGPIETILTHIELETRARQFDTPSIAQPTDITFGQTGQLKLIGYDLPAANFAPGDTLPVTLYWQAETEMDVNYTVFVQLLNHAGQVVSQQDLQPLAGAAPTTTWLPGEILTDPYDLTLPADLPPGDYRLITGLYHAATGERLPVSSGGDFVELQQVAVK